MSRSRSVCSLHKSPYDKNFTVQGGSRAPSRDVTNGAEGALLFSASRSEPDWHWPVLDPPFVDLVLVDLLPNGRGADCGAHFATGSRAPKSRIVAWRRSARARETGNAREEFHPSA